MNDKGWGARYGLCVAVALGAVAKGSAGRHTAVRGRVRRRLASAVAVVAAVVGFAPAQGAVADGTPPPQLVLGTASVSVEGPSAPLDLTVNAPTASDAYIRLQAGGYLRFTDDAGNPLVQQTDTNGTTYLLVGAEDSDHNGVPGAPIPTGVIHLHVSAVYPATMSEAVSAQIVDGATEAAISNKAAAYVGVAAPQMNGSYLRGWNDYEPIEQGVPLTTGASYPLTQFEDASLQFGSHPDTWHLRMSFTADELAQAGYTAAQFGAALRVQQSADYGQTWAGARTVVNADGSVSVDTSSRAWVTNAEEQLRIWAAWGLPGGKLHGHLQVVGPDEHAYGVEDEPLVIDDTIRPGALRAAFYGRDASGELWQYQGERWTTEPHLYYEQRQLVGGGWNAYTAMAPVSPFKADGIGDMVARDRDGVLWLYKGTGTLSKPFDPRTRIGSGWNAYPGLTGAGDVTGDGRPDLLARDTSGVLWLYAGTGSAAAPFAPRTRIGAGWNAYDLTTAGGDLTGDGRPDLLARDTGGVLWLYAGTGSAAAPYKPRVQIGTGWGIYTRIVSIGDLLTDGHADVLATDAAGRLWYYAGTGDAASPYKPRVQIGTGWGIYNALL